MADQSGPPVNEPPDRKKSVPPSPMPRDQHGWRVAPAPDGRGMPDQHKPRPPHRLRGFWIFVLVLTSAAAATGSAGAPSPPIASSTTRMGVASFTTAA